MRVLLAILAAVSLTWSSTSSAYAVSSRLCAGGEERALRARAHEGGTEARTVYAQARYLDPTTGRFLSLDPVAGSLSDPLSTQGFTYANANPTRFIDPDGRRNWELPSGDPHLGPTRAWEAIGRAEDRDRCLNGDINGDGADACPRMLLNDLGEASKPAAVGMMAAPLAFAGSAIAAVDGGIALLGAGASMALFAAAGHGEQIAEAIEAALIDVGQCIAGANTLEKNSSCFAGSVVTMTELGFGLAGPAELAPKVRRSSSTLGSEVVDEGIRFTEQPFAGAGKITRNGKKSLEQVLTEAIAAKAADTLAELRVAKLFSQRGYNVQINEALKSTMQQDMTLAGSTIQKMDVKRVTGFGKNLASNLAQGARQVGEGGRVVVVIAEDAKVPDVIAEFVGRFRGRDGLKNPINVHFEVVREVDLPVVSTIDDLQ